MSFAPGALVRARGREWVVLPGGEQGIILLRPLGGVEEEVTGILPAIEKVESATFLPPDPLKAGDFRSCRLLRDAIRLGFRRSAGPFRSFAGIAVEPRPYQLVPLLMALKLDPVRLLVADDVGVGKSIEASLIARELLDRGEIRRIAVICPPHLVEQWQTELRDKFHLDAVPVLSSTAARLERNLLQGQSLFDVHPVVVVSLDYIKSDRRRHDFLRSCPEFVVVDEAHLCSYGAEGRGGRHQRFDLVKRLSADPKRHIVLVTATPHSGNEDAFRSLLGLLSGDFADLPSDLSGKANETARKMLAEHVVQRRRGDIKSFMEASTSFPGRMEAEATYSLTVPYKELFQNVVAYAREMVQDDSGGAFRKRVRWWAVLSMLRALSSSPAAAAATFRSRAKILNTTSPQEADAQGRAEILDEDADEHEMTDATIGAQTDEEVATPSQPVRRLANLAQKADQLLGAKNDAKLSKATTLIGQLLKEGHHPIVFCRFIETAEYVARNLREAFTDTQVEAVTGMLPPEEREHRVVQLGKSPKRLLVCTDCLSEGINLQDHFDAVFHYDLSWNPTRHEQREGRVDRFGQTRPSVKMMTFYGVDNQIDGIVLDVLLRKHQKIRKVLGISVPIPGDTGKVVEAIMEGLLLKGGDVTTQMILPGLDEVIRPQKEILEREWSAASDREKKSRSLFAQHSIKVEDVAREVVEMRAALGTASDLQTFVADILRLHGAQVKSDGTRQALEIDLKGVPPAVRDLLGPDPSDRRTLRFDPSSPSSDDDTLLVRTHPWVSGLAAHVADTTFDPQSSGVARRCGAILTKAVKIRTVALLVRNRFHLTTRQEALTNTSLAEDCAILAFSGTPDAPVWLPVGQAEALLAAAPDANVLPEQARTQIKRVVDGLGNLASYLDQRARDRAQQIVEANRRVRHSARETGKSLEAVPQLPSDVLGIFVLLPVS